MAQSVHVVTPEATSRPHKSRHETPQLWLEREIHAESPYWSNALVGAGPALASSFAWALWSAVGSSGLLGLGCCRRSLLCFLIVVLHSLKDLSMYLLVCT